MSPETPIEALIRPDLLRFGGYAAAKSPDTMAVTAETKIVKLDANENPYGCSPRVNKALAGYPDLSVYPDATQTELRKLLADYTGVASKHIVASAGSDRLIDDLFRLLISPGDEVLYGVPTFAMFRFFTDLCGGVAVELPKDGAFYLSPGDIKKAVTPRTKLILLATPDNPTGAITPREDIMALLETGRLVLVDEAYYEFTGETMAPLVGKYDNLMVTRTFSKWAGLAGLRIGYGLFPEKIAAYLMSIKEPYCVNAAAQVAVRESLADREYLMGRVNAIIEERTRLFNQLEALGWLKPYPSRANFILCAVLNGKASQVQKELERRGVLVRYFNTPQLKDSLRISVGTPEDTDILIKALREIGGGNV
ncbi:MAG: histidinol-phosphate transaminase [Dehalococcoidales bacterium]|jgi:histidinol-phosphate aminotransferase